MLQLLSNLIGADKLGGWVRGGVASLLAILIAKFPGLSGVLDPGTQAAIGVLVSGIVVGIWQQLAKSDAAKVQMAAEVPSVTKVVTTDPAVVAATTAREVTLAKP